MERSVDAGVAVGYEGPDNRFEYTMYPANTPSTIRA
jgi:hypothetical protein